MTVKEAQLRYFELFWPRSRKTENNALLKEKNTKETRMNLKGPRMVKDGED